MPFNSYEFMFLFLPAALGGYWLLARLAGHHFALAGLLLASTVFYAYGSLRNLVIVAPSIFLNYLVAIAMIRTKREEMKSALLVTAVVANVLFLGYFKYKDFILDTVNTVLATHFATEQLLLPLGISFITFQNVAFLCDVRSGRIGSPRLSDFLLFTVFFPRVVAGPLVHYSEIVPQFAESDSRKLASDLPVALTLLSLGLFKKSVVADGLGQFVSPVFDLSTQGSPPTLLIAWAAALAFTLQIYFDFSGYSDMALGLARMFGVRLPINFNSPLKARSILEFWSRWHITLTRFLTTYIYTPMVLSLTRARALKNKPVLKGKRSKPSAIVAIVAAPTMVTMALSGLWHGAGWQFIVWGLLHGSYLTLNQSWRMLRPRIWPDQKTYERMMAPFGLLLTFASVVVAFVFFRAASVSSALSILQGMGGANGVLPHDIQLLRHLGGSVSPELLWNITEPLRWIGGLLLCVFLLPNSLELLRRFQPALDFPAEPVSSNAPPYADEKRPTGRNGWREWMTVGYRGISLNPLAAMIAALLFVLGAMSMQTGGAFLYWKF